MRKIALVGALTLLGAVACDAVLDIEDPKTRPDAAGEGGEPTATAGTSSGSETGGTTNGGGAAGSNAAKVDGGAAGEPPVTPIIGGGGASGGEGGEPPVVRECETGTPRCTQKAPEICDESGHWVANTKEASGDCKVSCLAGKCTECRENDKRCTICPEGDINCSPRLPQTCVDGAWTDDDAACKHFCNGGECVTPTSCGVLNTQDSGCKDGASCCASLLVPGGSFYRDYDDTEDYPDKALPATVSGFYLDKFEVTVARLRPFVAALDELHLADGAGKATHVADDTGWNSTYTLPTKAELLATLKSCPGTTWLDASGSPDQETVPANCLPFNVAYAFCIWDGGRLPTETEWNFAAAGGDDQRVYPWKQPLNGPSISPDFANYDNNNVGPVVVGSTPKGNGRWGQSDLAGNVIEWTLDYRGDRPEECNDCLSGTAASERTQRGGSFEHDPGFLPVSFRNSDLPDAVRSRNGVRCARDLSPE